MGKIDEQLRDFKPDDNPLFASAPLLCKLGSILVHVEEGTSADGHAFDVIALRSLMADPEVRAWLREMDKLALVPVKRNREPRVRSSTATPTESKP